MGLFGKETMRVNISRTLVSVQAHIEVLALCFQRKSSEAASSIASDDASAASSAASTVEKTGRDEELERLLEKYNVDEIDERPSTFYSPLCNRWLSLFGVSDKAARWLGAKASLNVIRKYYVNIY